MEKYNELPPGQQRMWQRRMAALLGAGLLLQLLLAAVTEGHGYDTSCFVAWGLRMADVGPKAFYAPDYFCDYPPGYLWVLGLVGRVLRAFSLDFMGKAAMVVLCFVPALCCCGLAWLVWRVGCAFQTPRVAFGLAACTMFCPVMLFDTSVWKQIDGTFILPLVGCFWLLSRKKYFPAAVLYGLALSVKPQTLIAGPVLALCFLLPLLQEKLRGLGRIALCAAGALAVVVASGLPFYGSGVLSGLLSRYGETTSSYPYAGINAFNFMAALGGNWQQQTLPCGPLSWQQWGTLALVLLTAALVVLAWQSWEKQRFCPLLLAAVYTMGVFTFAHRMHERYLLLGVMLVLASAARWADRRLLGAAAGLSLVGLVNLVQVYSYVGTEDEFMTGTLPTLVMRLGGFAETVCFVVLACTAWDILVKGNVCPLVWPEPKAPLPPLPQPRFTRREVGLLALLTAATLGVSLWDLGSLQAPQKGLSTGYNAQTVTVSAAQPAAELWVYPGVNYDGTLEVGDAATGEALANQSLGSSNPFCWVRVPLGGGSGEYELRLQGMVMEVSFRDEEGRAVEVQAQTATPLLDEQALVPQTISYRNSTYFDEIYHARTGYEMGHGLSVYETTHPPLGKDFIMLGILLFGMTGFGWRVMGVLFGAAMVPVFYLLVRRLTRSPRLAMVGGVLLALDGLRFVQTRIATIDVYVTFFILLSAFCMVWYCQVVLEKGVHHGLLPMALCGLSFGLGVASKWTGLYAGVGLAVVYFGVLWQRRRQKLPSFPHEAMLAIAGGVVFFVLVPLAVYLLSYLPYWLRDPAFGLREWWSCQETMFSYHSRLEATHPYESRWYTWPLLLRPVWYYMGQGLAAGYSASIAAVGNPVVWWGGTAGLIGLAWQQLSGRGNSRSSVVLVFWLAQVLPWLLVSRCTFLYHYFPGMIFALLALVLVLDNLRRKNETLVRRVSLVLMLAALGFFAVLWPVLSGAAVPTQWLQAIRLLPTWGW